MANNGADNKADTDAPLIPAATVLIVRDTQGGPRSVYGRAPSPD